jgi:hypothetical protein
MLLLLMQLFFGKSETKQSKRQNAANFCTRMRYESRVVGSADSASASAPSYTSNSSNCIHHYILWINFAVLCVFYLIVNIF